MISVDRINDAFAWLPQTPDTIVVSPRFYAMLKATSENIHRDPRRLKREVRKALKRTGR